MDVNWEEVATNLQVQLANAVARYEGQIAVLTTQLNSLRSALEAEASEAENS